MKEATLYLYIDPANVELRAAYEKHIAAHNQKIDTDPFPDSGFDILVPKTHFLQPNTPFAAQMVDFEIKTEMHYEGNPAAFYIFPRSSISKTPLMLANHTGIIDSGYRGNIKGAFRNLDHNAEFVMEVNTRVLQICHPSLCPVRVILQDFVTETSRGEGGFGSTGK
jgi:dUTP pyrophosphatase